MWHRFQVGWAEAVAHHLSYSKRDVTLQHLYSNTHTHPSLLAHIACLLAVYPSHLALADISSVDKVP